MTMGELLKSRFLEPFLPGTSDGPFPAAVCGMADVACSFPSCISGLLLLSSGDHFMWMGLQYTEFSDLPSQPAGHQGRGACPLSCLPLYTGSWGVGVVG